MKQILLLILVLWNPVLIAQEEQDSVPPEGWRSQGSIRLLFSQSAFNDEWTGGGTSSLAGNLNLDYSLNYKRGSFTWDNKFLATYGLTKLKNDEFTRKTSDRLELNSIAGKQLQSTNWYYSFFANFRTQLGPGFEYSTDPDTGREIRSKTTDFFSPAYLQSGPGFMWKKNDDLWFNMAPATARLIFVDRSFTSGSEYVNGSYYGVEKGESSRFEFGASFSGFARLNLFQNVTLENSLSLYSDYLTEPGNVDIDYLADLNMAVNDFLSANLIFQAIYDDNIVGAFQIREVFGAGLTYAF